VRYGLVATVFRSNRSGNWEIYAMDADGSGVRQLTDDPADDGGAIWVTR
jgi:Tol biopolymer transport system component